MWKTYWAQITASQDPLALGKAQLAKLLADPYQVSEAPLRQSLENTELAYNTAANRARETAYGAGAGEGGVSKQLRGNIEMSRGADKARNLREFEQHRQEVGDQRLQAYFQYLDAYNNALAIATGQAQNKSGNGSPDYGDLFVKYGLDWLFGEDGPLFGDKKKKTGSGTDGYTSDYTVSSDGSIYAK